MLSKSPSNVRRRRLALHAAGFGDRLRFLRIIRAHHLAGRRRILLANGALDFREPHGGDEEGTGSAQQFVEQHAQDVDIAGGGDRLTAYLFRAGMIRGHDANVGLRHRQRVPRRLPIVQQFCNAEIQELRNAGRGHQDIRGLEIAMHDEILVGIMNRRANRLKQLQPRIDIEPVRIAKDIDGHAVDIFHDDIGAAVGQGAAVQEMRNIRMIELGQYLALQLEARVHGDRKGAAMHDLDGNLLFELGIGSLGKINLAHPAGTQGAQHPVRPYAISHHFWSMHPDEGRSANRAALAAGAACVYESRASTAKLGDGYMPNGNEHKNPPPPPPPSERPEQVAATRPMAAATSLRRAQYAARPVLAAPSAAWSAD